MKLINISLRVVVFVGALAALGAMTGTALAQSVTNADIQRLQDSISDASRDISQVRSRDQALGSQLQAELDDLRDETIYLKVKLRKHEPTTRSEYGAVRDRIEDVRSRARGDSTARSTSPATSTASRPRAGDAEIPVGTEFDVRLQNTLNSATAQVEDSFEATTIVDLRDGEGDRVLVPAGSVMRGMVSSVSSAGRIDRRASMTVTFNRITVRGRSYPIRATVTQALESEGIKGEAGRIGTGAGVGAVIGGILGGVKGALAGILIGAGGTIAATEGKDVELAAGTTLRVRLDSGLDLN